MDIGEILPLTIIALRSVALPVAVIVAAVALWRGMKAQEETARRLAAIEEALAQRSP